MTRRIVEVVAVNRRTASVLLADDTVLPITDWFDDEGDGCEPGEAVAAVAGRDGFGWLSIDLRQFDDMGFVQ